MAQNHAQELGLRFGDIVGGDIAFDVALPVGETSRIRADISFNKGLGTELLWDFIYQPIDGESLHWYLGAGPYTLLGSPFTLGAVGEIGLEYRFSEIPLTIGFDWRPYFRLIDNTNLGFNRFGLNVRWVL